jgi:hypothetical protein
MVRRISLNNLLNLTGYLKMEYKNILLLIFKYGADTHKRR